MNDVDINCAVKLLHCDDSLTSNNVKDDTKNTDVSNKITKIKKPKSSRKHVFQEKSVVGSNDQMDNVKKKKNMNAIKKLKSKEVDLEKESKKLKIRFAAPIRFPKKNSLNCNNSKISDSKLSLNVNENNKTTTAKQSSLKIPKIKIPKTSITPTKNKSDINNINIIDNSNNFVPTKTPKSKVSIKNTVVDNINKDDRSNEQEKNDNFMFSKSPKSKESKSISSIKKKAVVNNVNDTCSEFENDDNLIPKKKPKVKISKPIISVKKQTSLDDLNKTDSSNESELSDLELPKISKTTKASKSISSKKISRKHNRSLLKKVQSSKSDVFVDYNNVIDIPPTKDLAVVLEQLNDGQKLELSEKFNDDIKMLRSNKPPKIKKKWSDEWSGDTFLNNTLKSLCNDSKVETNNSSKLIKKIIKSHKPKHTNYIKTKVLEKFNTNTNESLLISSPDICDISSELTKKYIPTTQSYNSVILTNSSTPLTKSITSNNDIEKSINSEVSANEPCNTTTTNICETIMTPTTSTEIFNNVLPAENNQPSYFTTYDFDQSYLSMPMINSECPEINYGMAILSEAISRQCREETDKNNKRKSPEKDINEIKSSPKKSCDSLQSKVPSTVVPPQKQMPKKVVKHSSELSKESIETDLQMRIEREVFLLAKRFNIPINSLKKTVVDEPLSVFHEKYSDSVTPSMVTISPIVKNVEPKSKLNGNYITGNLDVEYKVEPIRESAAYEKTNLKDLMEELTKTMPSWSLSIVTNPPRYVISHMSIDMYGVPIANKSIVLDRYFRASVYINQCLEYTYCKPYTTATEIVNLIKELNSI